MGTIINSQEVAFTLKDKVIGYFSLIAIVILCSYGLVNVFVFAAESSNAFYQQIDKSMKFFEEYTNTANLIRSQVRPEFCPIETKLGRCNDY